MTWKETALLALLGVAVILGASNCTRPIPPPVPPTAVDSGAPYTDAGASCVTACENIFALGCQDKPARCVAACENVEESGVFAYDVACMTRATSCAAVTACYDGGP